MKRKTFAVRYRWPLIFLAICLLAGSAWPLLRVEINADLETYLPDRMPAIVRNNQLEELFGRNEPLLICFGSEDVLQATTLERIRKVSQELERQDAFGQVLSLFQTRRISSSDGMMQVDPAIRRIPKDEEAREVLRQELLDNELAAGLVVSEDFSQALIMAGVQVMHQDQELMALVDSVLQLYPGSEEVFVTGQPVLRAEANEQVGRDLMILLPIAILVMLLFLWLTFKEGKGMVLPFAVVVISIVFSMGLIPLFGWELSIIGVIIPILLIATANNYGVHYIARYQELNAAHPEWSMQKITAEAGAYLKHPVVLTGLTTMAGIMGLLAHILHPAKQMGVVTALGIGLALLLSLTFLPAWLSLMKKGRPHHDLLESQTGRMNRLLTSVGLLNICCPRLILLSFGTFFILAGSGLFRLQVAADFDHILPARHSFNRANAIMNDQFGGAKTLEVMFEGDMKDPDILRHMDQYASEIKQLEGVGQVSSLAAVIRLMSQAVFSPDEAGYDRIPDTRAAVAQLLELYNMSGDPDDFSRIVDFHYEHALLTVQFQGDGLERINAIEQTIEELTRSDPHVTGIAGFSLVEKELSEQVARGQVYSLLFAFAAIFMLLIVIFRSLKAGWLGILPLLFAVFSTFGCMGWLGIELNIVTALMSSISIGLGVDYTIHLFWRLKTETAQGASLEAAMARSLVTTGRAISINAFAVIAGFAVLLFSSFPIIQTFGGLIILSIACCLIFALMGIPALLLLVNPSFLYAYSSPQTPK